MQLHAAVDDFRVQQAVQGGGGGGEAQHQRQGQVLIHLQLIVVMESD
jgi:hypothetical protein